MGNKTSSPDAVVLDEVSLHWEELFRCLAEVDERCDAVPRDAALVKEHFVSLFGGPSVELGMKLGQYLFDEDRVDFDKFKLALTTIRYNATGNDWPSFICKVVLTSNSGLESDLSVLLHAAAACALNVGSTNEPDILVNHPMLTALSSSILHYMQVDSFNEVKFNQWLTLHCPHLLTGLSLWFQAVLLPTSHRDKYHLPAVQSGGNHEKQEELDMLAWILSCVLPNLYMGAGRGVQDLHLPLGGEWTCLYSSSKHGFSLNRFQHHCYDYKQPSVMIVECYNAAQEMHSFALAMDSEWRDGAFFYGGPDFHLIQLQPTYSLLKKGAGLCSLNNKQRGFPQGLRVMASEKHDYCLFEVDSSLELLRLREGDWMKVALVVVWGCGGVEAMTLQQRIKKWEAKEVQRRKKIHRDALKSTWKDDPDRHLLEMAGISTSRPTDRPE